MPVAFAPSYPSPDDVRRTLDRLRALIPGDVVPSYERWASLGTTEKTELVRGMDRALNVLCRLDAITKCERFRGQVHGGLLLSDIDYEMHEREF